MHRPSIKKSLTTVKLVQLANLGLPATMHTLRKSGTKLSKKYTVKENRTELYNLFLIKPPNLKTL